MPYAVASRSLIRPHRSIFSSLASDAELTVQLRFGVRAFSLDHRCGNTEAGTGDGWLSFAHELREDTFQRIIAGAGKCLLPDNGTKGAPANFKERNIRLVPPMSPARII